MPWLDDRGRPRLAQPAKRALRNASSASAFTVLTSTGSLVSRNGEMKNPYKKPTLVKREKLTARTAQIVASGVILGE